MAEKVIIELDVDSKDAVKGLDNVNKSVEDIQGTTKKSETGVKKFGNTLKSLGSAAGIIGLIAGAFLTLKSALESSEEGQNKISKFFAVTSSVVDNLLTLISDLTLDIIALFENPQKAIEDFGKLLKENLTNRLEGLMELIPAIGKAIGLLFEGEFAEAGKVAANATAKVVLGVENIVEKTQDAITATQDFVKEIIKEADVAAAIADKRALADKKERELIVARAEANRQIAENREKAADKENVSTAERIRLLEEAGAIAEEITRKEIEAARLRFEALQEENKLANSNKEALDAEAQAQATLIELETARLRQQKALTAELTTTRREAAAEQKAIADQAAKEEEDRIARLAKAEKDAEAEIQRIKDEAADKERKRKEAEAKLEEEAKKNKLNIASDTLGAVAQFAEEGTELAKGVALAQVAVDVAKGLTATLAGWASLGPFGIAGAVASSAAIVASGIVSAKNILSTKVGSKPSTSNPNTPNALTPSQGEAEATALAQAPDFSINGDDGQSQLADTIQGANSSPIRAIVSSKDITTNAEYDRQTQNGAAFG